MNTQPRSAVLIVRDDKLLLIKREKPTETVYYVLPGGGIEDGETPEDAAVREMQEELAVDIRITSTTRDVEMLNRETYIVKASLVGDTEPVWQEEHKQRSDNHYSVVWLPLSQIIDVNIHPAGTVKAVLGS